MIERCVNEALEAYEANKNHIPTMESADEREDDYGDGNRNGNRDGGNGNGNPDMNVKGLMPVARDCTYQDFLKCQPLIFKGTEGVIGLTRWFEKMETRIVGTDAAYAMSWKALMKLMTEVYYPRNEIQKMETELWNLAVKGNDLSAYTQRFQELVLLCTKMVPKEEDRVEKFIGGLLDNIQGNVIVVEPTRLQDNVAREYTVGNSKKKGYARSLLYCNKCKLHHEGQCTMKCMNYKKVGHMTRDGRVVVAATTQRTLVENQRVVTCFGCGGYRHYKSDYPKLKNQNRGNKAVNNEARRRDYALGGGDGNPDSNVVTDVVNMKIKDEIVEDISKIPYNEKVTVDIEDNS
ncbi:reverse transcriptase domain-containing protein [Tanacetum coccineum]